MSLLDNGPQSAHSHLDVLENLDGTHWPQSYVFVSSQSVCLLVFAASSYLFTNRASRPGTKKVHELQFYSFDFVPFMSRTMIQAQAFLESIRAQTVISAFVRFVKGVYGVMQRQVNTFVYLFHGAEVINDAYNKVRINSLVTSSDYLPAK